jgi:Transmembrane family, TMEM144 of transporters
MNACIWVMFFGVRMYQQVQHDISGSLLLQTIQAMPAWHFYQIWFPGLTAGILLTVAMFGSILSVTYLGQGVGNSIVQAKILISGLWGILWFQEVRGFTSIVMWFLSATVSVAGIIWLSAERIAAHTSSH